MKRNYSKETEAVIQELDHAPTLLLHSCCAPCSSYVLSYLSDYFKITVLYYNPNIYPEKEYLLRLEEEKRLIGEMKTKYPVTLLETDYEAEKFFEIAKGLEDVPEGGERCMKCFELRLRKTAEAAKANGFDYFTTTLTISPMKSAEALNTIGEKVAEEIGVKWLPSDFKKKDGYKKSVELSSEYGLYRQNYCGCIFSQNQARKEGRL